MKKVFLLLLLISVVSLAKAENNFKKNEISASYGIGSTSLLRDVGLNLITTIVFTLKDVQYYGPYSIEYNHRISKTVALGGIFSYVHSAGDIRSLGETVGTAKDYYYTAIPAAKLYWVNGKNFALYSKVGIGLTFQTSERTYKEDDSQGDDTDHKVLLDGQVSYFGIEAGTKLCGFAELGGGQQGILLGGLRYKF